MKTLFITQPPQVPDGGLNGDYWLEYTGPRGGGTFDASFGGSDAQATMQILVPFWYPDVLQVPSKILGWSKANSGTAGRIERHLPMRHPIWDWMYASRISSVKGIGPGELSQLLLGSQTSAEFSNTKITGMAAGGAHSRVQSLLLTVTFTTPNYYVRADADVSNEWDRYVSKTQTPITQVLTREAGGVIWQETGGTGGPSITPPNNVVTSVQGWQAQLVTKTRLRWVWHQVPDNGLFATSNGADPEVFTSSSSLNNGRAVNLEQAVGKVNNDIFCNYPIGTLLFEGYELIPGQVPLATRYTGGDATEPPPLTWDVVLNFLHFDPRHITGNSRGHNLLPHPNGYWYLVSTAVGGAYLHAYHDFTKIFRIGDFS